MNKKLIILVSIILSSCGNNAVDNSAAGTSGTTATSKGCTSDKTAFRMKNSTASAQDVRLDTGAACPGTATYNATPATLTAGSTSTAYGCAPGGTYYLRAVNPVGTLIACSSTTFSTTANAVYTITVTDVAGGNITASMTQE